MKKLKIALSLLFALSCTLFLFACGGSKSIAEISITGQKTVFNEGDPFETGDIKVEVLYQGSDDFVELKAKEYDLDSSAYNPNEAGDYRIKVTPKDQFTDDATTAKAEEYVVTVNHIWQDKGNGLSECKCGAKQQTYKDLTSQVVTEAWGAVATYNPGTNPYPEAKAPATGENHVSLGTLVAGQSLRVTLRIDAVDTGSTWNTPLMGIRDGSVGTLPREDQYVIGTAAGYSAPAGTASKDGNAVIGDATEESDLWLVYSNGSSKTWNASNMAPSKDGDFATDEIYWNYQMNGIFAITHTLKAADGTSRVLYYTVRVPDSGYELVAYGEKVTYTIIEATYVENRAVDQFTATNPTVTEQAEGKMFDQKGITTKATFTKGSPIENSYQAYAYVERVADNGAITRAKVNLATSPLEAGMFDFHVEFGGKQVWFTNTKAATAVDEETGLAGAAGLENSLVKVVATQISGAKATVIVENGVAFEAPEISYDYALNTAGNGIQLLVQGSAPALNASQKTVFGSATHYIAFRLLGTRKGAFDNATTDLAGAKIKVVNGENGLKNVDVIAPITSSTADFKITLTLGGADVTSGVIDVNLSKLNKTAVTVSAEVTDDFYLDAGGIYTVKYTAVGSFEGNVDDYQIAAGTRKPTVKEINAATTEAPNGEKGYRVTASFYILDAKLAGNVLTVRYYFAAPNIGNLTANGAASNVQLIKGNDTLVSTTLYYNFRISANAAQNGIYEIGDGVYVQSAGSSLNVFKVYNNLPDVRDNNLSFSATLNLQNDFADSYNVGVLMKKGALVAADNNNVAAKSSLKLLTLGALNDNSDYDRGALIMMSVNLATLELRKTSTSADAYYFTANEDIVNGQSSYTIYKVGDGTAENVNKITTITRTGSQLGALTLRRDFNCVQNEIQSYTYKDGDATFYYGAKITKPASGQHSWEGTAIAGHDVCEVCNYTRDLVNGEIYVITPAVGTDVENTDTGTNWWDGALGEVSLSGDFAVTYKWQNIRDNNFTDVVAELNLGGDYYDATILETNYNAAEGTPATALNPGWGTLNVNPSITAYRDGEKVYDSADAEHVMDKIPNLADNKNYFRGNYTMSYVRLGTTLYVVVTLESMGKDGALSDKEIEKDETVQFRYTVVYKVENFTTEDVAGRITGNPYFIDNVTVAYGSVQSYFGQVKKADGKTYDVAFGNYEDVENIDTTPNDWWGFYVGAKTFSGDFAVQYTWQAIRDANYTNVVAELTDGTDFWDATILETNKGEAPATQLNPGWGILNQVSQITATMNGTLVFDSKDATKNDMSKVPDFGSGSFRGNFRMTIMRVGTKLTITVEQIRMGKTGDLSDKEIEANEVRLAHYVVTYTQDNFTTAEVTVGINGNPYWIDNIKVATGTFTEVTTAPKA